MRQSRRSTRVLPLSLRAVQHWPAAHRQEDIRMGSRTVMMSPKTDSAQEPAHSARQLGIQSDVAFSEAAKRLCGRDLCSISDLTVEEMAAVMELAHAVKSNPDDFRHALDGRQM